MVEKIKVSIEEAKESKSMAKTVECQEKSKYNNLTVWGAKISSILEKGKGIPVISQPYWRKRSAAAAAVVMIVYACMFQLSTLNDALTQHSLMFRYGRNVVFRQPRDYKSNGYIMISPNGGLNQMRSGICDMVAVARYLNATLIVPELDKTSFWNDQSKFEDIFDVEHFIATLSDQVQILKELPKPHKPRFSMAPVSWSNLTFYNTLVLQRLKKYGVLHFTQTDTRLANNGIPLEIQQLRCRANYEALKFTPQIEEMGNKIVKLLRKNGPFVALHLRYEMDMLAFTGCTEGCNEKEIEDLTALRYAYPWWKQKEIDSEKKRLTGGCPVTPEETALALRALEINPDMQIYIAAGNIYGGEKRLALLRLAFPHLVKKETLISASELEHFLNHSNQMAALDYYVSLESDIFVPTHRGNMALLVEGHRRYLGYRPTIILDRGVIVYLADRYRNGTMNWHEFSDAIKTGHAGQFGTMTPRLEIEGKPKREQYFYSNPYECMPPFTLKDHRP